MTIEPGMPVAPKKKLPFLLKLFIGIAIAGVVLSVVVSIGIAVLGTYLTGRGGKDLVEKGIEKMIESGTGESGKDVDVQLGDKGLVIKDNTTGKEAEVKFGEEGLIVRDEKGTEQLAIKQDQGLPAWFPSDLPIFTPSTPTGSMFIGPMKTVMFETSSSPASVSKFYQDEMTSRGWKTEATSASDTGFFGNYLKEGRGVTVTVGREESKVLITLSLIEKDK